MLRLKVTLVFLLRKVNHLETVHQCRMPHFIDFLKFYYE